MTPQEFKNLFLHRRVCAIVNDPCFTKVKHHDNNTRIQNKGGATSRKAVIWDTPIPIWVTNDDVQRHILWNDNTFCFRECRDFVYKIQRYVSALLVQ